MWTDFEVTVEQVNEYDPNLALTADKLLNFISIAQAQVENKIKVLIYIKFRDAGYTLPDDLPDEPLDVMLSDSFDQIKVLTIYKTLELVYDKEQSQVSTMWREKYDATDWNDIAIFIDVDESGDITSDEFTTKQDQLDRCMER